MKSHYRFMATAVMVIVTGSALAAAPSKSKRAKTIDSLAEQIAKPKSSLSRDIVFDGSAIKGKYHSAGEALALVEQEKNMNELIGFRRDFKDRLATERARLKNSQKNSPTTSEGL
jgi:hypothetical protein